MEWQIGVDADSGSLLPQVVEPNPNSPQKSPKDRLVKLLDQVEMHVERLRKDAFKLEEQRDTLLTTMDTIRNSEMMLELSDGKYLCLRFLNSFALRVYFFISTWLRR
jgi:BCL2-associated athanogene 2